MIPYEELVQALDRYVARNGGTPMSAHAPSGYAPPPPSRDELPAHDVDMHGYDEPHDPDMAHGGGEDATHVGASPGSAPAPLQPVGDEGSNEIDIGDVLADDELS
jgi:hypothetical protein